MPGKPTYEELEKRIVEIEKAEAAHKLAEQYWRLANEVLMILNESADFKDSIQRVLEAVKQTTCCDALGLRLKSGEDYPYFLQSGFSDDFLLTENSLLERDRRGELYRNPDGTVRLERTCGLVISGKVDPSNPLFTPGGSAWTNDSFPFLDLPEADDPRHHPRNQCIHQGYASIALIPIRNKGTIVGLLQVNGHKKGLFTTPAIHALERIASDIGEALLRKQAEDALRESEVRYRTLFERTANPIMIIDHKGNYINANDSALQFFECSRRELLGKNVIDFNPSGKEQVMKEHRPAWETGGVLETQYYIKGKVKTLILTITPGVWRGKPVVFGNGMDITGRKRVEDALKESEMKFRILAENIPVMLNAITRDEIFTYWNKACEDITGYCAEETIGNPRAMSLMYPDEAYRKELARQWMESGGIFKEKEIVLIAKDGSQRHVLWTNLPPEFTFSGRDLWAVGVDITERKQAEAEKAALEAQNRQLQKAESLGRMAGAIAHHFNNQLQAVMGNIELAMDDLPRDTDIPKKLAEAMNASRKASEISGLMLTYLGQTTGSHIPVDLSEVCRKSLALLRSGAPEGMFVKAEIPSSGPVLLSNDSHIQQILTNLMTNAWEASVDHKGVVTLTVKTISGDNIPAANRLPVEWQPDLIPYACLEVTDEGQGIPETDIEKIFDPFFSRKFTGRGLGLSVVMGIVKAHHGGITVESEWGRGSTFRVFLPISSGIAPPTESPGTPKTCKTTKKHGGTKGGTVLLVEDDRKVRRMAENMLDRMGYTVLGAKDGFEAVEIFKQQQQEICCVVSDLTMPHMDGWETLTALRKLLPDIPVILCSGYDEAQVMAKEHDERPDAFLGKPYQRKDLGDTIERVLREKSGWKPE